MNFKTITTMLVAVVVVVLIAAAAIVPIVQEAQSETRTSVNNSDYTYAMASGTVEITTGEDSKIYVNGLEVTENRVMIVVGNDFTIYRYTSAINLMFAETGLVIKSATIADGTLSYVLTDDTAGTHTYTGNVYYAAESGEYALYNSVAANLPKDTTIYGYIDRDFSDGNSTTRFQVSFVGTLEDGFTFYAKSISTNPIIYLTDGTIEISYEEMDTYNAVAATAPVITLTDGETTYTSASNAQGVVKFQYVAPLSYQIITNSDSMIITMLGVIPLLIFIVPIMLIVRSFYNGRD